ncbi:MAG: ABC transporter permease [Spirochaetaceae bacterium]|jgi:peptide/nickel transport system permease protein|nr:ABC transporter permease [Spirochaetaceae bacterium]
MGINAALKPRSAHKPAPFSGGWCRVLKQSAVYALRGVTLLFAASMVSFMLVSASPIDPLQQYVLANPGVSEENIARMEAYWGLNEPPLARYGTWISAILHGDLGMSKTFRRPVAEIIGVRFGASLALMAAAWTLTGIFGFGMGCLMGMFHGRLLDRVVKRVCLVMCAVPTFWIGLVFLMVFSAWLGWFPFGMAVPAGVPADEVTLLQRLHHLVLPALTLSFLSFANVALHTREKLVDVLESDYVLFAKARGEKPASILRRHGLRNILIPVVTMQFGSFSELFGGSVIAENIFSYPGLGAAATSSAATDIPLFLGITLFSTLFVFAGNMTANILYGIINPKIREGYHYQ